MGLRFGLGALAVACACSMLACEVGGLVGSNASGDGTGGTGGSDEGTPTSGGSSGASSLDTGAEGSGSDTTGFRFDVALPDAPASCMPPMYDACDADDQDPFHALGLGCPGDPGVQGSFRGHPSALMVQHGQLGTSGEYAPREGERFVVLSTGVAAQLPRTPDELKLEDPDCNPRSCPSTQHSDEVLGVLPEPIDVRRVSSSGVDCKDDPGLIGTGDCSNSLEDEFLRGGGAYDYAELRFSTAVPLGVDGLSYEFAFFTVEYPDYVNHAAPYSDMYLAWLESEAWTGNISFDALGHAITVNGVLLDYKDAPSTACPDCSAPELEGFAMQGHGATRWLNTTAPVQAGELVTLVFAIFDMNNGVYDSLVALDHFEWTCSGAPPFTTPVG
ncbi:MAG: choice-of-anchor L domain-containing protein [Nannocystaceae bacterium]|jgi:hypothetical protein